MRIKAKKRMVPLTVMIAPDDLEWIRAQGYGSGDSMGRVIRQLIQANRKLHDAIIQAKGEQE